MNRSKASLGSKSDKVFGLFLLNGSVVPVIAALALGASIIAGPALAQEDADSELVQRVQARYEQTEELEAAFTQQATLKTLNETQTSSGKLFIKKPGNMRWDYIEPEPQVILLKGNTVMVYTPDLNQVIEQPVTNLYRSKTPTAFLAGRAKLTEIFNVKVEPTDGSGPAAARSLLLRPKEDNPQLKELRLEVDPTTYDITRSVIIDHFGNETDIRYINVQTNHGLEEGTFALDLPANVERVRAPSAPLD